MPTACVYLQGGFGNRVFQLAFLFAYGKKHNVMIKFFVGPDNPHTFKNFSFLFNRFLQLPNYDHNQVNIQGYMNEENFQLFTNFPKINSDTQFGSYFQNEKYFLDYRQDILKLFASEFHTPKQKKMFIQARLDDYVFVPGTKAHHFVDLNKYFERCLALESDTQEYLLFSDSPDKIYTFYPCLNRKNIQLISQGDGLIDFYTMVNCEDGGICSNSSFGWLASWMNDNPDKKVYMPDMWLANGKTELAYTGVKVVETK